jgi:hypothetical protein
MSTVNQNSTPNLFNTAAGTRENSQRGAQNGMRNELHGLLRQEIGRVIDAHEVRKQTIIAMQNDINILRDELDSQIDLNHEVSEEKQ